MVMIGAVVAALMLLRPAQPTYTQATPLPVHTPQATAAAPTAGATATPREESPYAAAPEALPPSLIDITELLRVGWPIVLLGVGSVGLIITVRRLVRRRMAYTGQSVGMLLGAADAQTRAANLRVLRDLQSQGSLPPELAAAAGIGKRPRRALPAMPKLPTFPRPALPHMKLPAISLPRLSLPELGRRGHTLPVPALTLAPTTPLPVDERGMSVLLDPLADALVDDGTSEMSGLLTATDAPLPELALPDAAADSRAACWNAEDRALAVAGALASIWSARGLGSPILAIDTSAGSGAGQVVVTIDPLPDEEERLVDVPEVLVDQHHGWRSRWKISPNGMALLVVDGSALGELPRGGPLLVPVLTHGRGDAILRFFPLAAWRHLAIYGGEALGALHAILSSLLYTQSPREMALAICDAGRIAPLYRDVAHLVAARGDARETLNAVAQAMRRTPQSGAVRPVVIVVVEPDATALAALTSLIKRLRHAPDAPVHLIVTQKHLSAGGREAYALMPALITEGGHGLASWLPGQGDWPRRGMSRLVGRGLRVEGRPPRMSEMEIAEALAPMRRRVDGLPAVIWERTSPEEICPEGEREELGDACSQQLLAMSSLPIGEDAVVAVQVDGRVGVGMAVGVARDVAAPDAADTRSGEACDAEALQTETFPSVIAEPACDPAIPTAAWEDVSEGIEPGAADEAILWPNGPGSMDADAIAELFDAVLGAPAIIGGAKPGISRGRLRPLLRPEHQAQAAALLCWMDAAGVLVEPARADLRWRESRPLASHDLLWVARRLADTAIPDVDAVQATIAASAAPAGR